MRDSNHFFPNSPRSSSSSVTGTTPMFFDRQAVVPTETYGFTSVGTNTMICRGDRGIEAD